MAFSGRLYATAKQQNEIDAANVFQSMLKRVDDSGAVVIDGRSIAAESIYAHQIHAEAITADKIKAGEIDTQHIAAGAITVDKIEAGSILLPGSTYGGVKLDDDGLDMTAPAARITLSNTTGFLIRNTQTNTDILYVDPATGNVSMVVNSLSIRAGSSSSPVATREELENIELTPGPKGDSAPVVNLSGATQIIKVAENGTTTPASNFTVTASTSNTTISSWQYAVNGGSFSTSLPTGVTRSGTTVTINPSTSTFTVLTIRVVAGTVSDNFTIARALDGARGSDGTPGTPGADGRTPYFHTAWANNANGTSGFSTTVSTDKLYIGTYTNFTQNSSNDPAMYSWTRIKGDKGDTGATGTGVTGTTIHYANHTSGTSAPTSGWTTNVPAPIQGRFLWTRTVTSYSDGTSATTYSIAYNATDGQRGNDGNGIASTQVSYQQSTSGTSVPTGTWSTSVPTPIQGRYLWTRTIVTYTDGTSSTSYSTAYHATDGQKGDKGDTGEPGRSITSVDVEYYLSTSATTLSGGSWVTTPPNWTEGRFMWTRTKTTYSTGNPTTTDPVSISGAKGETGAGGSAGRGISNLQEQYYLSTSKTTQSGDAWRNTAPEWKPGHYMWTRIEITYINPTGTTHTDPILDSSWEAIDESIRDISLADKDTQSGTDIYTDKADDAVVHVDVDGKSIQDGAPTPDNPVEIHSLNDFDVVSSVGKRNLFIDKKMLVFDNYFRNVSWEYYELSVKPNTSYTISLKSDFDLESLPLISSGNYAFRINNEISSDPTKTIVNVTTTNRVKSTVTLKSNQNGQLWLVTFNYNQERMGRLVNSIQLEEGFKATLYTPAPEDITENDNHPLIDKINLLLSEPLRSVGDVKDRLFRDSDGLWKIERNVGEHTFNGTEGWILEQKFTQDEFIQIYNWGGAQNKKIASDSVGVSNRFVNIGGATVSNGNGLTGFRAHTGYDATRFRISPQKLLGVPYSSTNAVIINAWRDWLSSNNVTITYLLQNPTIKTLSSETQQKLNHIQSFKSDNYLYTLIDKTDISSDNLNPQLHATFKSEGWYRNFLVQEGLESNEYQSLTHVLNQIQTEKERLDAQFTDVYDNSQLANTGERTTLQARKTSYNSAYTTLESRVVAARNTISSGRNVSQTHYADIESAQASYRNQLNLYEAAFQRALDRISSRKAQEVKDEVDGVSDRVTDVESFIDSDQIVNRVTSSTTFQAVQSDASSAKSTLDSKESTWDGKATPGDVTAAENRAKSHAEQQAQEAEERAKTMGTPQVVPGLPPHDSGGAMHNNNHGLYLQIDEDILIEKVMVNSGYSGALVVQIRAGHSATGTILQEKTFEVRQGVQWLNLNFLLKKSDRQTYTLLAPLRAGSLYRNQSFNSYPIDAGSFKITGAVSSGFYYYFYNIHVAGKGVIGEEFTNNNQLEVISRLSSAEQKITPGQIVSTVREDTSYQDDISGSSIVSRINQLPGSVTIDAKNINLNGAVTIGMFNSSLRTEYEGTRDTTTNLDRHTVKNMFENGDFRDTNINLSTGNHVVVSRNASNFIRATLSTSNTTTGGTDNRFWRGINLQANSPVTISVEARAAANGRRINIGQAGGNNKTFSVTTGWQVYTFTYIPNSTNAFSVFMFDAGWYEFNSITVYPSGGIDEQSAGDLNSAKTRTDNWSFNNTTEIDGGKIRTETIEAAKISGRLPGNKLILDSNTQVNGNFRVNGSAIIDGTLTANQITTGILKDKNNQNNINLDNGTFSLANGNITYNGSTLSITGGVTFGALDPTTQASITNGAAAKSTTDDIMSDLKITPVEKAELSRLWERIKAEYTQLNSQASSLGVAEATRNSYTNAYNALNSTPPRIQTDILANMTTTFTLTTTTRDAFSTKMNTYFVQAEAISKAITDRVQANANAAQGAANTANNKADAIEGKINNAITTIDGTGVTVKDGSFFLEDDNSDTKYSIVSRSNLLKDHSFELVQFVPDTYGYRADSHGHLYIADPYHMWAWRPIGSPRVFTTLGSSLFDTSGMFGMNAVVVNSSNYVSQDVPMPAERSGKYTVSGYFTRSVLSSGATPRISVRIRTVSEKLSTEITKTFTRLTTFGNIVRFSYTFDLNQMTSGLTDLDISAMYLLVNIKTSNSEWIMADGIQLVKGENPIHYAPEESLFDMMNGVTGSKARNIQTESLHVYGDATTEADAMSVHGATGLYGTTRVYGNGNMMQLHSSDTNGHGYYSWFNSAGSRVGYLGYPNSNNNLMEWRNESGGAIRLTGSALSFNGTQVVASGSNSNGEWVRFYDGTQIAQKRLNLARSVSSTSTELPVSFSNEYGIFLSHNNNDNWAMENVWMFAVGRLNSGAVSLRRYGTPNSGLTWNTQIIITAIGRA